jgi:hypothetical protein
VRLRFCTFQAQGPSAWAAPSFVVQDAFVAHHEPGDTPDELDPAQVQRVARLCLATAWLLANP